MNDPYGMTQTQDGMLIVTVIVAIGILALVGLVVLALAASLSRPPVIVLRETTPPIDRETERGSDRTIDAILADRQSERAAWAAANRQLVEANMRIVEQAFKAFAAQQIARYRVAPDDGWHIAQAVQEGARLVYRRQYDTYAVRVGEGPSKRLLSLPEADMEAPVHQRLMLDLQRKQDELSKDIALAKVSG